jgi:hypothetical protein
MRNILIDLQSTEVRSFIGWSAQDASLLVDAKIAVQPLSSFAFRQP